MADQFVEYFKRQIEWSRETFGPFLRTKGICEHITKELKEIEDDPQDLSEWVDVMILAMDGFWRHGGLPEQLLGYLQEKQRRNFARSWPDWREIGDDHAVEHNRPPKPPKDGMLWFNLDDGKTYIAEGGEWKPKEN